MARLKRKQLLVEFWHEEAIGKLAKAYNMSYSKVVRVALNLLVEKIGMSDNFKRELNDKRFYSNQEFRSMVWYEIIVRHAK